MRIYAFALALYQSYPNSTAVDCSHPSLCEVIWQVEGKVVVVQNGLQGPSMLLLLAWMGVRVVWCWRTWDGDEIQVSIVGACTRENFE
jgi:hypothetical protein